MHGWMRCGQGLLNSWLDKGFKMGNAVFYGFQFPHHGNFSAFSALSREFERTGVRVCKTAFPNTDCLWPGRIRGPVNKKWFQLNEFRLKRAFSNGDLVHYFFPENSLFKAPEWKKKGSLVLSCHQPLEQMMARPKTRAKYLFEGLKAADAVVLMASCELEKYQGLAPNSEVLCIPHGVETNFFCPAPSLPEPNGTFRVLTVGNWLRDYDLWAKVVDRVVSERPDVEFSVLANPDRLKAATQGIKIGKNNVRVLQGVSDEQLRDEYRRADVVFLPLKNAWANNALLESMACGRPLLATDLPAIREYAGDAACFVPRGDADGAAHQIIRLRTNPDLRNELGRAARIRMESGFCWKHIAARHIDLYENTRQRI